MVTISFRDELCADQLDETSYEIVADLKVKELNNLDVIKLFKCTAKLKDSEDGVTVESNHCEDQDQTPAAESQEVPAPQTESTEPLIARSAIKLENEVQSDTAFTSGEQFIAIPRDQPNAHCIGCASHVNPQAAGVSDLANLGIRHLDLHEPSVKHTLNSVLDVERQVQVVNGVRYILTQSVLFNKCGELVSDECTSSKTCRITILVKPWVKLPNGKNYRAILANNCTEEWQYGDNGEVLPELTNDSPGSNDGILVINNKDLQTQPNQQKTLSDEELKLLQEQIIPRSNFEQATARRHDFKTTTTGIENVNLDNNELKGLQCTSKIREQPWLHKKSIDITCTEDKDLYRIKRQLGGEADENPNDPTYRVLAEESLQKYLKDNGITEYHKVDAVERVTTQVVSGSMTRLEFVISNRQNLKTQKCYSKVWEQPWLDKKEITVSCTMLHQRLKRDVTLKGSQNEQNPNDPKYRALAEESLQKYLKDNAITEFLKVDRVVKVTTQVVSGSLTRIHFAISNAQNLNQQECHSKVWEQPWLNKKDITVDCALLGQRVKRQGPMPGSQTEQNPNDPTYRVLAEESLQKYLKDNAITEFLKVDKVVKVTTQVVSGSLTRIDFAISNTQNLNQQECHSEVWEQPWLNKKDITVDCALLGQRVKRQGPMLGAGENELNPNDPTYRVLAEESLQKYLKDNAITEFLKVDQVVKVKTQVVEGSLTRIDFVISNEQNLKQQECRSEVWERSWLNKKDITVDCALLGQRVKRQGPMPGSQTEQNPNDPTYRVLAEESLQKYLKDNAITEFLKVDQVVKVTTQVVSGSLTRIVFAISNAQNLNQQECHSEVWEQPWLNKKDITVDCALLGQRVKRQGPMPGSQTEQNPNDPTYRVLAEESLQKYLKDNAITEFLKVDRVVKVTTQVVSGSLTRIDFAISNAQNLNQQECHSEVWEQPWLNKKDITVDCALLGQRVKRQGPILGGETEQNPNDPTYRVLAEESLQKYLKDNAITEFLKVDRVVKVTTQVVSGSLTRIDFAISNAQNLNQQECHSKVWEQPWLNKKDITVDCALLGQRVKRQGPILGGETERNPNDPTYRVLAEESLQKYVKDNAITEFLKVDQVVKVKTQVVEGSLTRIDFVISNEQNLKQQECRSEVWERSWLNKKDITVDCALLGQRVKRQGPMLGSQTEQNPNDPTYRVLAEESLQKYLKDNAITEFLKVDQVVKVTTQVVEGSLTRIDFVISNAQNLEQQECHSEVWERSWLNKKDITVDCALLGQRAKRQGPILGGETVQNPNDPTYRVLAEESLQKYVKDNAITEFLKVDQVVKVTTQVVEGSLTRIDFVISNAQNLKQQECHSEVWERSWLNKKDITVDCALLGQRVMQGEYMMGAPTEENPNDPKYRVLAEESLQKYVKDNAITEFLKVDQVVKVTLQIVAGSLTRIDFVISNAQNLKQQECHSKVWERSWLNKKDITVDCALLGQRVKRQGPMPGSQTEQNPNDPTYRVLAEESLQKYLKDNAITEFLKVDRVVKVTTQVVSGSLTRIDFAISNAQNLNQQECHSKVWEQPWLNKKDITVDCALLGQRVKRQGPILGGETERNPNDPTYRVLAEESLQKYVKDNAITEFLKVDQVVKVTTQVVEGSLTRIDFVISNAQNLKQQECHSEVWERSWLNKKDITVDCALLGQRVMQGEYMMGAPTEENPNDPKYRVLAEESLQKYVKDNAITEFLKVDQVVKVTLQIVAGSLTRIDFVISNAQNLKQQECHSKVWERSWLNKKDITVDCALLGQRVKRQGPMPGSQTEQNPNDPTYRVLAEESLQKYLKDNAITEFLKVDRAAATTQVVSITNAHRLCHL
ncbi:unnamed protein product [Chrysodeixis includens]|uniref:Cystatin domain-containing protein n=1 Tax=Chrysodeixis includens TaxID=689277 RepID=A0A9P0BRN9_CHRIL|nr:unnamed protein product [Chrysodeixis includens]